jgi:hypothetical protein
MILCYPAELGLRRSYPVDLPLRSLPSLVPKWHSTKAQKRESLLLYRGALLGQPLVGALPHASRPDGEGRCERRAAAQTLPDLARTPYQSVTSAFILSGISQAIAVTAQKQPYPIQFGDAP